MTVVEKMGQAVRWGKTAHCNSKGIAERKSGVLLDEATAALDNQTSYAVIDAVLSMKEMTEIIVTHRLEEKLLYQYDEILVMHAGEIVEKGTFQELMQKKGFFYSLYVVSKE